MCKGSEGGRARLVLEGVSVREGDLRGCTECKGCTEREVRLVLGGHGGVRGVRGVRGVQGVRRAWCSEGSAPHKSA